MAFRILADAVGRGRRIGVRLSKRGVRSVRVIVVVGVAGTAALLGGCSATPAVRQPAANAAGGVGAAPTGVRAGTTPVTRQPVTSTPCWAGTWLVRAKTVTVNGANGGVIQVVGDAGEVITLKTNGVLFADYTHAGALVGTTGSGPIAVQYQGVEDAQLQMSGSTSGTFAERIVDGALFTTVSDGQSNTQKDQPGATETDQYVCTPTTLTLNSQGLQETMIRNG